MTSGLSHRADLYEIDNSSARASRLIQELAGDDRHGRPPSGDDRRLAKTAKPYFGDVEEMTYLQWATRRRTVRRSARGSLRHPRRLGRRGLVRPLHRPAAPHRGPSESGRPRRDSHLAADHDAVIDSDAAAPAALAERYRQPPPPRGSPSTPLGSSTCAASTPSLCPSSRGRRRHPALVGHRLPVAVPGPAIHRRPGAHHPRSRGRRRHHHHQRAGR